MWLSDPAETGCQVFPFTLWLITSETSVFSFSFYDRKMNTSHIILRFAVFGVVAVCLCMLLKEFEQFTAALLNTCRKYDNVADEHLQGNYQSTLQFEDFTQAYRFFIAAVIKSNFITQLPFYTQSCAFCAAAFVSKSVSNVMLKVTRLRSHVFAR